MEKKIYNVTKWLSGVFAVFVLYFFLTGSGDYQKFVIYDNAVTTTNDTLVSAWIPLNGATNVSLFYNTDDTSYVKGSIEYRYGTLDAITLGAADTLSLDTRGGALTGLSKGKILQGFGLATSLIPGANAVRVTMIWKAGSETTTSVKVGLVYGD
jgi:hypothetical protein